MNRLSLSIFTSWVILLGSLTPTMNAYAESQQNKRTRSSQSQDEFKRCVLLDETRQNRQAAQCYQEYIQTFPQSRKSAQAYYNQALCYQRDRRILDALKVQQAFINHPNMQNSDLHPEVFFQMGVSLQALARYSQASQVFESFVRVHSRNPLRIEALRRASTLRIGLGHVSKAESNLKMYIAYLAKEVGSVRGRKKIKQRRQRTRRKRIKKRRRRTAKRQNRIERERLTPQQALVYLTQAQLQLGQLYQQEAKKNKRWTKVIQYYQDLLKELSSYDELSMIKIYTQIGHAYLQQSSRNVRKANQAYSNSVRLFKRQSDSKDLPIDVRNAAAEALFKLTLGQKSKLKKRAFSKVKRIRNPKQYVKALKKQLIRFNQEVEHLLPEFEKVIALQSPQWSLAALASMGDLQYQILSALKSLSIPSYFNPKSKTDLNQFLTENRDLITGKAVKAYELCLKKSLELNTFNQWTDQAKKRLIEISPERFKYSDEEKGEPTSFGLEPIQRPLVLKNESKKP